jgi:cAMP-dependent protein kinase regulator
MGCGWSSDGGIEHEDTIEQVKDGPRPSPYSLPSDSPITPKAIADKAPVPSPSPPTPAEPPRTTPKEQGDASKVGPSKAATIPPSKPVPQQEPRPQPQTLPPPRTPTLLPDASPMAETNATRPTTTRPLSQGKDISEFGKTPRPSIGDLLSKPKLVTHVRSTAVVVSPKQSQSTKVKKSSHHLKNVFATPLDLMGSLRAPVFPKDSTEKAFVQNALQNNFVFSTLGASELNTIIDAFERVEVLEDDTLIQQGDVGDYFYIIREGKVRFEVNGTTVGYAVTGKSFGELSLLYTSPRAASVIAEVHTSLYRVDQKTFRYIMQSQTLQTENDKKDLLKSVPFLKSLDPTDINKLIHTMVPRVFEPGEYLVRKGEVGDTFYVIQEGTVSVTEIRIGSTNYEDQTLGPGDYFGERALVTKEPRAANCVGKTKGLVLCIDKETFEKAVGKFSVLTLKSEDCRKLVRSSVLYFHSGAEVAHSCYSSEMHGPGSNLTFFPLLHAS